MRRAAVLLVVLTTAFVLPGVAAGHDKGFLDHPPPAFDFGGHPNPAFQAGGEGAEWELIATFPTGNPHTDLDWFMQDGDVYVSVGTLANGPNAGGQTIFRLTEGGEVSPSFFSAHPSAACVSNPAAALGLQHDVEATPKGAVVLNTDWGDLADTRDAQLLLDATDAAGRCHDQGPVAGFVQAPRGGLEIVDVTDVESPVEIALTSHIGEAHTVNVDPSRPHIAYAVTSDFVRIVTDEDTGELRRLNEFETYLDALGRNIAQPLALDGLEVVDLSSCLDFPAGTEVDAKRGRVGGELAPDQGCRPEVYRFRFEMDWTRGTLAHNSVAGCHELELHPGDILTCAGVHGTLVLDMSGAFDADGRPNGDPLPCQVRESSSSPPFFTAAPVIDCVNGGTEEDPVDLRVPNWLEIGAPSLQGVELVGFVNHGGNTSNPGPNQALDHHPSEDVQVSHEAELTHSRDFLIVSDERGGAVIAPGAGCLPDDQWPGNGGLHALRMDRLFTEYPAVLDEDGGVDGEATAEIARQAYALTPDGEPAIYRAPIRVPAETLCTAHVFQQIPGQNRIFMGWYTQGTQVVDYVEHDDGTFEWREAAFFIPANANQWVSHVFRFEDNGDGTFTYWGVAGDFALGEHGRNAVDVYRVTLPAPQMAGAAPPSAGDDEAAPPPPPAPEPDPAPLPATGATPAGLALLALLAGTALAHRRRSA